MSIGRPLIRLDDVTSTMDLARQLAIQGATPGTAVLAGYQSQGKGRAGRQWQAARWSSILVSFITASQRPMESLGLLSLAWGLAVARTADAFTGVRSQVKWPNDVLIEGRKVSGILVTNHAMAGSRAYRQVTGIGLNVSAAEDALPTTATSLAIVSAAVPAFEDVLRVLFSQLDAVHEALQAGDDRLIVDGLSERLAFVDEPVEIQDGQRTIAGIVRGIDARGALLLEDAGGHTWSIAAGELTRGPRRNG